MPKLLLLLLGPTAWGLSGQLADQALPQCAGPRRRRRRRRDVPLSRYFMLSYFISFISFHLILSCFTLFHFISFHFIPYHSCHLISSHFALFYSICSIPLIPFTKLYFVVFYCISSSLTSFHFISCHSVSSNFI